MVDAPLIITPAKARAILRARCAKWGAVTALAETTGVPRSMISSMMTGAKAMHPKVAKELGLRPVHGFVRIGR